MEHALRQELRLVDALPAADGRRRWMLHDPVAGRYHRLGEDAVAALGRESWPDALVGFLQRAKLLRGGMPPDVLASEELAGRPTLGQLLVHKYLFFRVPLVRPDSVLRWLTPKLGFVFTRAFWWLVMAMGMLGLALVARQWDVFAATFMGFLSPAGMVGYGLSLVILKCLHELGHGVAATRYGVRVPVMGVAFLVMFPVLYTDTTGAWEVRSRRARMIIDAAGMATEIAIACAAILLWSFLPDGPARSVAFFLATTSWTLSLLVNLNPCMRFDGYYLIGDALGVANLQETGFGLARWKMREVLFGLGDPKPDLRDGARLERTLLAYAYGTWVYRFFLFVGIALLVHHLFPKAIGIVLFVVEIGMFIALPASREVKHWWGERARIMRSTRGRRTLVLAALMGVALFAPLSQRVQAPAQRVGAQTLDIYPGVAGRIVAINARHGDLVQAGAVIVRLESVTLDEAIVEADLELRSALAELARAEAADGAETPARAVALARAEEVLDGLRRQEARLSLRAPVAGRVEGLDTHLHVGRAVGVEAPLLSVRTERVRVEAWVSETDARRIEHGAKAIVISSNGKARARVRSLSPVSESYLSAPLLAAHHGGEILADEDARGRWVARVPRRVVRLELMEATPHGFDARARVFIDAEPESVATKVWRRVMGILVREADF